MTAVSSAVELITIGDELMLGFTIDTNSAYLAQKLAAEGIAVVRRTAVGDTMDAISSAVREALDRTGAVITTGGLGPTSDDITRDAIAAVFGTPLEIDEAHLDWMRERWRKRFNRDMPESNRRQAMLPRGARKLDNRHGSAPGALVLDGRGRFVVMLPGVPRELRGMADDILIPLLHERRMGAAAGGGVIVSRTVRTTGVAESLLADQIEKSGLSLGDGLSLAYLPGIEGVDLRLTARADSADAATRTLDNAGDIIRRTLGQAIYGTDGADLADVLLGLCRERRFSIAVAESCTGGLLGARLTAIPGSSDVFAGGVIAYSNEVKTRELGVAANLIEAHGAVSEEVVREMARGAREKFRTDVALSITGIAGPGGGTPEKPVGLVWLGAIVGARLETRRIQSWGDRQEVRYRATQASMDLARRLLTAAD